MTTTTAPTFNTESSGTLNQMLAIEPIKIKTIPHNRINNNGVAKSNWANKIQTAIKMKINANIKPLSYFLN